MIELKSVSKSFPGVKSLDGVDFEAKAGEIHALLGENGAGKSTLIKTIAGAYTPDAGTIVYDGAPRAWSSPKAAKDAGIHVIYQEFALFPELSVAENIFAGEPPRGRFGQVDHGMMRRRAAAILDTLGHHLDPAALVKTLSVADRQMVEIARAMIGGTKLLVLDEPTAVISGREAELLFERMRTLRRQGVCIIYISHRLEEIFAIADRVTVLKDGRHVATRTIGDIDRDQLVAMMVGRSLADIYPAKSPPAADAATVLTVRNLVAPPKVRDVSFELRKGEILGVAGMVGSGRSETAHALFGSLPRASGSVSVEGSGYTNATPAASIALGMGLLTEDRKGEGLHMLLDGAANISSATLREFRRGVALDQALETDVARREIARFRIAIAGPHAGVRSLSGGNQQKLLFARWARACRRILILDEPTRGVDVGAKVEIYGIIRALANEGVGIIIISSELPEVIGLCTRVLVMREGCIAGAVEGEDINEQAIMRLATFGAREAA